MKYSIYLDNNSTTAVDPRVMEVMLPIFTSHFGNPSSQSHEYGWYAAELVEIAREQVAAAVGASPKGVVFTSGATEASNLALKGVVEVARAEALSIRPHVITGATEHRATLDTLRELESRKDIQLTVLRVDSQGCLSPGSVARALQKNTILVSLMLANNEIGAIHPVAEIGRILEERDILFHCDATQALGKLSIDIERLGVDLLSLSAHKAHGPKGVGAVVLRNESLRSSLRPQLSGGGHEGGMRSGTLNVPGIAGFGRAAELAEAERPEVSAQLRSLSDQLLSDLRTHGIRFELNGPDVEERLPGNLNLFFPGAPSAALLPALQGKVACSASSACSSAEGLTSHVLAALGLTAERIDASIRLGIGRFNTHEEIRDAAAALTQTLKKFQTP